MVEYIQVITIAEKREDVQKIATSVVEKRLAGCAQIIGPIISTYWWNDKIENTEEWLCLIKSKKEIYDRLEKEILDLHPYEVPEILAMPVIKGNKSYLEWLNSSLLNI